MNYETAEKNYIKAICKGLYKVMSKMGISTIRSYRGAKIFEAVGLSEELLKGYFGTNISTIGGIRLDEIAKDYITFHDAGFEPDEVEPLLPHVGLFSFRKDGEKHAWNPETIATLQLATRTGNYAKFKEFTHKVDEKDSPIFLRDFFTFKKNPIHIDQVEPIENIVKHFVTGAMSSGAISRRSSRSLGSGDETSWVHAATPAKVVKNSAPFPRDPRWQYLICSKTKQIASGRFGVNRLNILIQCPKR